MEPPGRKGKEIEVMRYSRGRAGLGDRSLDLSVVRYRRSDELSQSSQVRDRLAISFCAAIRILDAQIHATDRMIAMARLLGVPEALGLTNEQWLIRVNEFANEVKAPR